MNHEERKKLSIKLIEAGLTDEEICAVFRHKFRKEYSDAITKAQLRQIRQPKELIYVPPELKREVSKLKSKLRLYETFQSNTTKLQGCINKLKVDIQNYEKVIDILKKEIKE
jgi:hypothetical protein